MKKILFVIENFRIGGIQKSFLNLLNSIADKYDIDVAAFDPNGEYKDSIPKTIRIVKMPNHYQTFAKPRSALKTPIQCFYKILFFILCKLINKGKALYIVSPMYRIHKQYDVVISFSHSGFYKGVNGICPEFVISKTKANVKICFIHCDYEHSGLKSQYNNALYARFDKIACCSDSVKRIFLQSNPALEERTFTVRNFFDLSLLRTIKEELFLPSEKINVFSVARLSKEKGLVRAIEALHCCGRKDINYYIIGDGSEKSEIDRKVLDYNLNEQVFLWGAISNPYPKLLNADYLLVPSYNEAAPMVFDEARVLGIRVIATETTSAREMLESNDIICENSMEGLCKAFSIIDKPVASLLRKSISDNSVQLDQFNRLIN